MKWGGEKLYVFVINADNVERGVAESKYYNARPVVQYERRHALIVNETELKRKYPHAGAIKSVKVVHIGTEIPLYEEEDSEQTGQP